MRRFFTMAAAGLMLSACATGPAPKYDWGTYEQSMYTFYKDPSKAEELMVSMETMIKGAEAGKRVVPPGLYAEYGFLLMMKGKPQDAVANFEKEKIKWPESAQLMDRMSKIALAQPATKGGTAQ